MKKRVVIAGAGISIAAPSNLPSWWQYNQEMISAIKSIVLARCPQAQTELERIDIEKSLPVQCISDLIVKQGAGQSYFPLLSLLDGTTPNFNHLALAELASLKELTAIITTNFDRLIETAFTQKSEPLSVIIDEEDFLESPQLPGCRLFKIHGSVTSYESLIDTVTQKARGLSTAKRLALSGLLRECEIVVMGFSGADLDFDLDYIPFTEAMESGSTVTWISYPGSRLNESVAKLMQRYGDSFRRIETELPAFFQSMGVTQEQIAPYLAPTNPVASEQSRDALRDRIHDVFSKDWIGFDGCVGYCIELLNMIGEGQAASRLSDLYEDTIELPKLRLSTVIGLQALAAQRLREGKRSEAKKWLQIMIRAHKCMHELTESISVKEDGVGREPASAAERECMMNLASCYSNLGLLALMENELASATDYLSKAKTMAELTQDSSKLSVICFNLARVEYASKNDSDRYLSELQDSGELAASAGNLNTYVEIVLEECKTRLALGEYALVRERLEKIEPTMRNTGLLNYKIWHSVLQAELLLRNGETERSLDYLSGKLSEYRDRLTPELVGVLLSFAVSHYPYSDETVQIVTTLSSVCGKEDKEILRQFKEYGKQYLVKELNCPQFVARSLPNSLVRASGILYEYRKQKDKAYDCYNALASEYMKKQNWRRLADMAKCMLDAAQDAENKAVAKYYLGCSCRETGNYLEAAEYFTELTQAGEATPAKHRRWAHIELANMDLMRGEDAGPHYRAAVSIEGVSVEDQLESAGAYIQMLAKLGKWDEAQTVITEHLARQDLSEKDQQKLRDMEKFVNQVRSRTEADSSFDPDGEEPESIATEALRLFDEGGKHREAAWSLIELAREKYAEQGNRFGEAKCENNLGSFFLTTGNLEKALEHLEYSLEIKKEVAARGGADAIDAVVSQLATIISLLAVYRDLNKAKASALVQYAETHIVAYQQSTKRYELYFALFQYYLGAQQIAEAQYYAKQAGQGMDYLAADAAQRESRKNILQKYLQILDEIYSTTKPEPELTNFEQQLSEASRIGATQGFRAGRAALERMKKEYRGDPRYLGRIEGTIGNLYQNNGKHAKAAESFRKAISYLSSAVETQNKEMETHRLSAVSNLSVSLERMGNWEESCAVLEGELLKLKKGSPAEFPLRHSYCNRLIQHSGNIQVGDKDYQKIQAQLDAIKRIGNLTHEQKGLFHILCGNLYASAGQLRDTKEEFSFAKEELIRCNSPHLQKVEQALKMLQEYNAGK